MVWKITSRLLIHLIKLACAASAVITTGAYLAPFIGMGAFSALLLSFTIGGLIFISVFPGQQSLIKEDADLVRRARRTNFQIVGVLALISFVLYLLKL